MNTYFYKVVLALLFIVPAVSYGQYCNTYHKTSCEAMEPFSLNGQSKSALFSKGQTSELNIIVYSGQDYRISLCWDDNLGEKVTFKLYESTGSKLNRTLLYDNAANDFLPEIEFSAETTKRLILEVAIPEEGGTDKSAKGVKKGKGKKKVSSSEIGCVGVLVEHMKTPKSGF